MTAPKVAAFADGTPVPRHWEKRVLASYLRMMGLSQAEASQAVGRAARSLRRWESETVSWAHARTEAEQRWLRELTDAARVTLLKAIREGAGDLAMRVLERTVEALAPPQQRLKVSHTVGEGLSGLLQAFEGEDADVN
jgi:cell division inhibitor SulA